VRVLVLNSTLMINPSLVPQHAFLQSTWLVEELEQCKLCAMQVVIFSYHSFFEDEDSGGGNDDIVESGDVEGGEEGGTSDVTR
jgi:hypothetical protein